MRTFEYLVLQRRVDLGRHEVQWYSILDDIRVYGNSLDQAMQELGSEGWLVAGSACNDSGEFCQFVMKRESA